MTSGFPGRFFDSSSCYAAKWITSIPIVSPYHGTKHFYLEIISQGGQLVIVLSQLIYLFDEDLVHDVVPPKLLKVIDFGVELVVAMNTCVSIRDYSVDRRMSSAGSTARN